MVFQEHHITSLRENIPRTKAYLEKTVGTLIYLENLKEEKKNCAEFEPCSICCLRNDSGVIRKFNFRVSCITKLFFF